MDYGNILKLLHNSLRVENAPGYALSETIFIYLVAQLESLLETLESWRIWTISFLLSNTIFQEKRVSIFHKKGMDIV